MVLKYCYKNKVTGKYEQCNFCKLAEVNLQYLSNNTALLWFRKEASEVVKCVRLKMNDCFLDLIKVFADDLYTIDKTAPIYVHYTMTTTSDSKNILYPVEARGIIWNPDEFFKSNKSGNEILQNIYITNDPNPRYNYWSTISTQRIQLFPIETSF